MQTAISPEFENTATGRLAGDILRKCVHCGFCNATCPTYHLLGDELDGPRGRIYQMKQLFEGGGSGVMRTHLDRCLLCRACEPACPSGVRYSALLEVAKTTLDEKFPRTFADRTRRRLLGEIIIQPRLFAPLWWLGRLLKGIVPRSLADKVPDRQPPLPLTWPQSQSPQPQPKPQKGHPRRMLALAGCVQSVVAPNTNLAAATVLDRLGITLFEVDGAGCCGGVPLHTSGEAAGRAPARALIDRWLPHLEGVEAIVMTASGCGVTIKDYPRLFADDPEYREKARRISEKTVDLCEVIARELPPDYQPTPAHANARQKVAFHAPCTLQHAQRITGSVESILARAGYTLCAVRDSHLCCGSAGTYSILQPTISAQLRRAKRTALAAADPDVVCTANVGCQLQLGGRRLTKATAAPVVHWIELLL